MSKGVEYRWEGVIWAVVCHGGIGAGVIGTVQKK